jgi:gamma-glutamyltranspeptidase/glutathione hydrolase
MHVRAILALSVLAIGTAHAEAPQQPESTIAIAESAAVTSSTFMVSAAHPEASRVGQAVLAAGGNAIDAIVAVQFMLNLVEPQSSGIGGGSFLLYWDAAEERLWTFDGRETAPAAAGPDLFLDPATGEPMAFWDAVVGGRSVGVPGTLKLLETVHERFGSRPWAELVEPTIELAEAGFTVSPRLAGAIAEAIEDDLGRFAATREYFLDADGAALAAGSTLANPAFAATLRQIAAEGSAPFYTGDLASRIVAVVTGAEGNAGQMSLDDLAGYEVLTRDPICVDYRRNAVCGMGPPSSGGLTVGQILGLLGLVDIPGLGYSPTAVHLFLEASRLAFADRALYMADADFVPMPIAGLLDPTYLMLRAQALDFDASMGKARAGNPPWRDARVLAPQDQPEPGGTTHVSIVDSAGNAVSFTSSIETGFGSRLMVGGFLLNNQLTDFSFRPMAGGRPVANRVEPGKRPRSSMAPTIVFGPDGEIRLVVGSPGGARIIDYVAQTLVGVLDWGMNIQAAIDLGHFTNLNGDTTLEAASGAEALAGALEALGHEVKIADQNSGLHGIERLPEGWRGGADPRREGIVLGD